MFRQGFEVEAEGVRYKSTNGHQPGPYQYYVFAVRVQLRRLQLR